MLQYIHPEDKSITSLNKQITWHVWIIHICFKTYFMLEKCFNWKVQKSDKVPVASILLSKPPSPTKTTGLIYLFRHTCRYDGTSPFLSNYGPYNPYFLISWDHGLFSHAELGNYSSYKVLFVFEKITITVDIRGDNHHIHANLAVHLARLTKPSPITTAHIVGRILVMFGFDNVQSRRGDAQVDKIDKTPKDNKTFHTMIQAMRDHLQLSTLGWIFLLKIMSWLDRTQLRSE